MNLLADLHELSVADPVLATLISELRLVPVGAPPDAAPLTADRLAGGFDLLVYPIGFDTVLRFGPGLTAPHLAEAFVLLDLMRSRSAEAGLPAIGGAGICAAGRRWWWPVNPAGCARAGEQAHGE